MCARLPALQIVSTSKSATQKYSTLEENIKTQKTHMKRIFINRKHYILRLLKLNIEITFSQ